MLALSGTSAKEMIPTIVLKSFPSSDNDCSEVNWGSACTWWLIKSFLPNDIITSVRTSGVSLFNKREGAKRYLCFALEASLQVSLKDFRVSMLLLPYTTVLLPPRTLATMQDWEIGSNRQKTSTASPTAVTWVDTEANVEDSAFLLTCWSTDCSCSSLRRKERIKDNLIEKI